MSELTERFSWWMIRQGFATGHGDTIEDLEAQATAEVTRLREQIETMRNNCMEECEFVRTDAARQIGELLKALRALTVHATYPVSTEINARGYAWRNEKSLDYAKGLADAALGLVGRPE
jgi:hypothetical protein